MPEQTDIDELKKLRDDMVARSNLDTPKEIPVEDLQKRVADLQKQKEQLDSNKLKTFDYLLQFFTYEHLPPHLQEVSKQFAFLANHIVESIPSNPERTMALRKLLEAKDCAVRAVLFKQS